MIIYLIRPLYIKHILPKILYLLMKKIHQDIEIMKRKLFIETIQGIESNETTRRMEVLEIGVGCGENFLHFPKNSNVHIVDKTDDFLSYMVESFKDAGREDLNISKLVVGKAECMDKIESNSMDLVVHTFILCSVDNPALVLSEIYRVLKPNGVCIFVEHSLDSKNFLRNLAQILIAPIWYYLLDCKFKPMKNILQKENIYDSIVIREFSHSMYLVNPIVFGYGKKI